MLSLSDGGSGPSLHLASDAVPPRLTKKQYNVLRQLERVRLVRSSTKPMLSTDASAVVLSRLREKGLVEQVAEEEAPERRTGYGVRRGGDRWNWYRLTDAGREVLKPVAHEPCGFTWDGLGCGVAAVAHVCKRDADHRGKHWCATCGKQVKQR